MPRPPAFQWYGKDFDASTASWSNEQVGAYVRLLNFQWENSGVPDDPESLARILRITKKRAEKLWFFLAEKFPVSPSGERQNQRLEQVREEQLNYRAAKAKAGYKGAMVRWQTHSSANSGASSDANASANGKKMALRSASSSASVSDPPPPPLTPPLTPQAFFPEIPEIWKCEETTRAVADYQEHRKASGFSRLHSKGWTTLWNRLLKVKPPLSVAEVVESFELSISSGWRYVGPPERRRPKGDNDIRRKAGYNPADAHLGAAPAFDPETSASEKA